MRKNYTREAPDLHICEMCRSDYFYYDNFNNPWYCPKCSIRKSVGLLIENRHKIDKIIEKIKQESLSNVQDRHKGNKKGDS